jgi:hypothetical protein
LQRKPLAIDRKRIFGKMRLDSTFYLTMELSLSTISLNAAVCPSSPLWSDESCKGKTNLHYERRAVPSSNRSLRRSKLGVIMSFSRFVQVGYLFGLSLSLSLLLCPSSSRGQYRATPGIPGLTTLEDLFPFSANFIPNNGRIVSMPGPPLNFMLNNFLSDTTGSPLASMGMQGCMGFGGISGGIVGVPPLPLPATGFLGGGLTGINGGAGGGFGGQGGFGGGAGGLGMGGAGGMGGFAGKGMGGFNGKKAL